MSATYPAAYSVLPIGAAPYAAPAAVTVAAIAILSPTASDAATITAGSQVATLPAANLQSQQPKKVWRSASASDYLNVSFATPIAANMLALDRPSARRRVECAGRDGRMGSAGAEQKDATSR